MEHFDFLTYCLEEHSELLAVFEGKDALLAFYTVPEAVKKNQSQRVNH